MRMFCAALLLCAPLTATELFSWHTMDTRVAHQGRVELFLHHRTRLRDELHFLEQSRVGAIARIHLNPKTSRFFWLAGYYFQPNQRLTNRWDLGQRVWGGFEAQPYAKPGHVVMLRAVSERHFNTGRPAYFRHRTALRYTAGTGRVRPFVQNELLAVWPGFHSTRNSGGLWVQLSKELLLEATYLYDSRRTFWGGDRQAVVTMLRWTPKGFLGRPGR